MTVGSGLAGGSVRPSRCTIWIVQSARSPQPRPGGEFFAEPTDPTQRRYEALRAYLLESRPAAEVANAFGYTVETLNSLVRDFRSGRRDFFVSSRPGPKRAPAKDRAHDRILELRSAGHSIDEIALVLAREGMPLNRTGIAEVIAEEGFERLWRRPEVLRGAPRREQLPRTGVIDFDTWPERVDTKHAGLLLCLPDLVALDLPAIVKAAGYPGTSVIPAVSSVLALLALKLASIRRTSHVEDLATDHGAALFAGLSSLPKTTALTSYSYKLSHERQHAFLVALNAAMLRAGLIDGADFDLDFHAIMHWGEDPALEKHYVPSRSQRTRSVLTFFAQDAATRNIVFANADISKATQAREVIAFCEHWRSLTGTDPGLLVFDQKLTTQAVLAELDERGVTFMTLRMRSPALIRHIDALDPKVWKTIRLERDGNYRKPQVVDETVRLSDYPRPIRQLVVRGLGRESPTVLIAQPDEDRRHRPSRDQRGVRAGGGRVATRARTRHGSRERERRRHGARASARVDRRAAPHHAAARARALRQGDWAGDHVLRWWARDGNVDSTRVNVPHAWHGRGGRTTSSFAGPVPWSASEPR